MEFLAVADDFTGGSDLAGMLFERGVRVIQTFGAPREPVTASAVVVSLKSRSIEPEEAVAQSLAVVRTCPRARTTYFKYCSTFDSTARGNIGPVTAALLSELGVDFTIAVPAVPALGRTQYMGHLFVHGVPLDETSLRTHPLNPMTDSNLVRHLQQQTSRRVGLLPWGKHLEPVGEIALADVLDNRDLERLAERFGTLPLLTGGSGLPAFLDLPQAPPRRWPRPTGRTLILSGSCSRQTLRQLAGLTSVPRRRLELDRLDELVAEALAQPALCIESSAPEGERMAVPPGEIEQAFAEIARRVDPANLIVAGGETSGAVVKALGIDSAEVTGLLDPGVPELRAGQRRLVLKSGNLGGDDFFERAR